MLRYLVPLVVCVNVFAMPPKMDDGQMNERHQKMKAIAEQTFSEVDTDKSGSLNTQEFSSFKKKMTNTMEQNKPSDDKIFKMMDRNQDGVISKDEIHPPMRGGHEGHGGGRM